MRLVRYLFTAVLALSFVSCNKGRSSDEPKPNNGEQTTSSKQSEEEIGFGQRELTLRVGETAKVTLHGVRNPRIETSNSNLIEVTLIEQGTAVSLKGLQVGKGTIRVFSSNRYAELRVVVKSNEEGSNNPFNGMSIFGDKISYDDYILSADGLTLVKWKNKNINELDMNHDPRLRKVTFIGEHAFYNCKNLTGVNIPNSVTTIGNQAFYGCSSLTSVNIPNSVTTIGSQAFHDCSNLTSINIPRSITNIEEYTFYGCSSLKSVHIPNSVTSIGDYAFNECNRLTRVIFKGNNPPKISDSDHMFWRTPNNLKFIIPKGAKSAYIKAGYPEDRLIEQ